MYIQGFSSEEFIEYWSDVSRQVEMSLLSLLVLHYWERNESLERECYDVLRRWRLGLNVKDMKKLKEHIRTEYLTLLHRRLR